ncbi:MAG TPA: S41 family peptidase [Thermoanaerobaculia bacterium]|jgi:hypothetical protein
MRHSGDYLKTSAMKADLAGATTLPQFLGTAGTLTLKDRLVLARQALILIEQNYAHLPLKRAMHAVDPVQRLKLIVQRLEQGSPATAQPETDFHREMTEIFTSLHDLHTNYLLPDPFNRMTAFLPFMVEDYVEKKERHYIVSHVAADFKHATFKTGVEVLYWNGMPIDRAVAAQARRYAGSNLDAQHARGVQTLTTRALIIAPPPDEEWVIVRYRTASGDEKDLRFDWMVAPAGQVAGQFSDDAAAAYLGVDLEQHIVQQARKVLFAPHIVLAEKATAKRRKAKRPAAKAADPLESEMPSVFQAKKVDTPSGKFGYLRIRTFSADINAFIGEFQRLLAGLPKNGLIIDVRGNGGGVIFNGERILQLLTPRTISPEPVQFLNTTLNLQICKSNNAASKFTDLTPWVESMQQALQTGATFSAGFPITSSEACNDIGQRYFGPVVLITDASCYSTTDIFAAGFQDHEIGPVLGVDSATGAGGANVWTHALLCSAIPKSSVYEPLPNGAGMRVSMRRTLRVGKRAGMPVEDLGVLSDDRHPLTRNDLLQGNVDLIAKAASLLAGKPPRSLELKIPNGTGAKQVTATTTGMDRLDIYVDERPIKSINVTPPDTTFTIDAPSKAVLEIRGFDGKTLVARYRQTL